MSRRGWILFIALSVIWGVPYLLIRIAVRDIDPLLLAFGRTLIGSLLLLPIALYRREVAPALRLWKALLLFTLVEISGPWLLLGHAETRLTSSTAGLLIAIVPLTTAVMLTLLGHERLDFRRMIGLVIGLAGVVALVGLNVQFSDFPAVGAAALTALGYAAAPIIINRKLASVPPLGVVACSLIIATLIYAPFVPFVWPSHITAAAAGSVVGLGVLCTAVAFVLFFALIAETGPARATVITYINPAVAIALGVLVLDEPLTLGVGLGFALVIIGSTLGTTRGGRARSSSEPVGRGALDAAE